MFLDIFFLLNVLIDLLLLRLTAWTRQLSVRWPRLWIAAAFGSIYVLWTIIWPEVSWLASLSLKVLVAIFMLYVAFGYHNLSFFLRNIGMFFATGFLIAGFKFATFSFSANSDEPISGWLFMMSLLTAMVFLVVIWRSVQKKQWARNYVLPLVFAIDEYRVHCMGLIDTGNHLTDPLTGAPVHLIDLSLWRSHLPAEQYEALVQLVDHHCDQRDLDDQFPWLHRVRLIPFRTASRHADGTMLAIRADYVQFEWTGVTRCISHPLIACMPSKLSQDDTYRAILHPAILPIDS